MSSYLALKGLSSAPLETVPEPKQNPNPTETPDPLPALLQSLEEKEEQILGLLSSCRTTLALGRRLYHHQLPSFPSLESWTREGDSFEVNNDNSNKNNGNSNKNNGNNDTNDTNSTNSNGNKDSNSAMLLEEDDDDDEEEEDDEEEKVTERRQEEGKRRRKEESENESINIVKSIEKTAFNYLESVSEIRDSLLEFGNLYITPSYLPYQSNCYIERTRVEVLEMILANYQTRLAYLKEKKKEKEEEESDASTNQNNIKNEEEETN